MPLVETTSIFIASQYCIIKTALVKLASQLLVYGGGKAIVGTAGCSAAAAAGYSWYSYNLVLLGTVIFIKFRSGGDDSEELKISASLQAYIDSLSAAKRAAIMHELEEWLQLRRPLVEQREAIRALLFIEYNIHPYNEEIDRRVELSESDENKWVCCICYDEYDPDDIITFEPCKHAQLCFKCDLINNLTRLQKAYLRSVVIPPRCPLDRVEVKKSSWSS